MFLGVGQFRKVVEVGDFFASLEVLLLQVILADIDVAHRHAD